MRLKIFMVLFFAFFLGGLSPAQAFIDYCQVLDTGGKAEVQEAGSARWQPLLAPRFLKGGDKIRTFEKSYAEISTSYDFSGLLKIGANSELEVLGEDFARFFLRRGFFFVPPRFFGIHIAEYRHCHCDSGALDLSAEPV